MIIGTGVVAHAQPYSWSAVTRSLAPGESVGLSAVVPGENWIVGDQTFYVPDQGWQDKWYQLDQGDYVYYAWVYLALPGEVQPWDVPAEGRSVRVDTTTQQVTALSAGSVIFQTGITSGKPGTATGAGDFNVNTRLESEIMQSSTPGDSYYVERILFTQYFYGGIALHLNYWQPNDVFGGYATSHGCVGLRIHDAQWMWLFGSVGMPVSVV
jgi:hypothetical protein